MTAEVSIDVLGGIAVLTLRGAPGNLLTDDMKDALLAACAAVRADRAIGAVVLAAAGADFSTGIDPAAGDVPRTPLPAVIDAFGGLELPVVAALQGEVLDGGLELAMACHWRIATPQARLGLTGTRIGLLPAGGGSERLPRLVGPRRALDMILGAEVIEAAEAVALGLVDGIAHGDLLASAIGHARSILQSGLKLRPSPFRDGTGRVAGADPDLFRSVRLRVTRAAPGWFAPPRCVDAIEAGCLQPPAQARAVQAELAELCRRHPQVRALLSVVQAEQAVMRPPALPAGVTAPDIRTVGLQGDSALKLAAQLREAGLTVVTGAELATADLIYATGLCDVPALRAAARPGCILATATADVPPGIMLGLRLSGLAEIVQGETAPDAAVAAVMALVLRIGATPVLIRRPGLFLTAALGDAWRRAIGGLVESGISADRILRACAALGFTSRAIPVRQMPGPPRPAGMPLTDEAILGRCVAPLAEEGRRLVAEGWVRGAAEVDVAAIHSLGFPRYRGGPMYWARAASLPAG